MKTVKFLILFFAAAALAACGSDNNDKWFGDYGQIKVPDTRQLEQTAGAEDTQTGKGVSFTTEGAWTSTIASTRAEAPDWISVSPDHGDAAGSYTLKITLQSNGSEQQRSATITIVCGTSKIEIVVTQEGTDDPITPILNSRISKISSYGTIDGTSEEYNGTFRFEYDAQNRITAATFSDSPDEDYGEPTHSVVYSYPGSASMKVTITDGDAPAQVYNVILDASGRATAAGRNGNTDRWTFGYDADGNCTECRQYGTQHAADYPRSAFGWENGCLVGFDTFRANGDKAPEFSYTIAYDAQTKNDSEAMALDLNALIYNVHPGYATDDEADISGLLAAAGRLGKRSALMTRTDLSEEDYESEQDPDDPNILYHFETTDTIIEWTADDAGRIIRTVCTRNVQYIKENIATGEKETVDGRGHTYADHYVIAY